jgi:hypothetical protein
MGLVSPLSGRNPPHRSFSAVASPARNSSVPACEARLTAQPCCGSAAASAAGASVAGEGRRSVLLSRMNVCRFTSGASSMGISSRGSEGGVVAEVTASGHARTRSEASAAWTLWGHICTNTHTEFEKDGAERKLIAEGRTLSAPSRYQFFLPHLWSLAGRPCQRPRRVTRRYLARAPVRRASCPGRG